MSRGEKYAVLPAKISKPIVVSIYIEVWKGIYIWSVEYS
jgi:hypothetical protein